MKYLLPVLTLCLTAIIAAIGFTRDETAPRLNLFLTKAGNAQDGLHIVSGVRQPELLPLGDRFNRYSGVSEDGRWLRFWDVNGRLWHYDMQTDEFYLLGDQSVRRYIGQVDEWLYLEDRTGIFRVRFDGSQRTDIFALDSDDTSPTFTPDKKWLIYKANLRQFARVRRDGSQHLILTPIDEIHHFDGWSEDGRYFYTIGTLNTEAHLTQVNIANGELRVIVDGIDEFFGEQDDWVLYELDGRLYRQHLHAPTREVLFEAPDLHVQDAVWNKSWLYVEVLNLTLRQDEIYTLHHDGSNPGRATIAAPHAPLLQSHDGVYLASTTPTDPLVFITGKHVISAPTIENDVLIDVWQDYFIFERNLASGASQYFAQAAEEETPYFMAQRPAGFDVVEFVSVDTRHWQTGPLMVVVIVLVGISLVKNALML